MTFVIGFLTAIVVVLICLLYILFKQFMSLEKEYSKMADFVDNLSAEVDDCSTRLEYLENVKTA